MESLEKARQKLLEARMDLLMEKMRTRSADKIENESLKDARKQYANIKYMQMREEAKNHGKH